MALGGGRTASRRSAAIVQLEAPLRVLALEDDPIDFRSLQRGLLRCSRQRFELVRVERLQEAIERVHAEHFDAVLLDLFTPDSQGPETFHAALREIKDVPVVVLTGQGQGELAQEAIRAGAQDFLLKQDTYEAGEIAARSIVHAIERHRLQAELERERQRRESTKERFLSHVSHELRTPLTAVHQFAAILKQQMRGPLNESQLEFVEIILRNSQQLRKMIGDLLDVTRSDTGKLTIDPEVLSLPPALREICSDFVAKAGARGIQVTCEVSDELPRVYADPSRLRQILDNLVDNALKFTPAGGSVTLRASAGVDGMLRVDVVDTGCGLPEAARERVFDRLYQAERRSDSSRRGLGLGLFLCRELVTRHGGRIWVESAEEEGSTFSFTLPSFDLARLLLPVIRGKRGLREHVALVCVKLAKEARLLLDPHAQRSVRGVLERCVHPDRDLVLPALSGAAGPGVFFAVASADKEGIEAIVARLRERLASAAEVPASEAEIQTEVIPIAMDPALRDLPAAEAGRRVAEQVLALVESRTQA